MLWSKLREGAVEHVRNAVCMYINTVVSTFVLLLGLRLGLYNLLTYLLHEAESFLRS
jgi:hypothetical protein